MATTTVRLPEPLKAESEAYAASLGISLNALMAVALRDYLDGRSGAAPAPPAPAPVAAPAQSVPLPVPKPRKTAKVEDDDFALDLRRLNPPKQYAPPLNPKWNCPCGSKKPWLKCHGRG